MLKIKMDINSIDPYLRQRLKDSYSTKYLVLNDKMLVYEKTLSKEWIIVTNERLHFDATLST